MSDVSSALDTPLRVAPRIVGTPKIRQLFWCDFPKDAQLPEFWKRRPVVILSSRNTRYGAVTVVPCSTSPQAGNRWAHQLVTSIDGREAWAICDKITTVATSRLLPDKGGVARMSVYEFEAMLALVLDWLPKPLPRT